MELSVGTMQRSKIEDQGIEGEDLFQSWLQTYDAPFLRVDNDVETYTLLFQGKLKRPDFLLLIAGMGLLSVDVKNYKRAQKSNGFFLNFENELNYSVEFEHAFKMFLWYAIRDKDSDDKDQWYFISAYDALDNGKVIERDNGTHYYDIAEEHFTLISDAKEIPGLLKERRGITGLLTQMLENAVISTKLK